MISVNEACREILKEHTTKKGYSFEYIRKTLISLGGEQFICSDQLWKCYGKKKLYNIVLQKTHVF
jgi:hypothetical protein